MRALRRVRRAEARSWSIRARAPAALCARAVPPTKRVAVPLCSTTDAASATCSTSVSWPAHWSVVPPSTRRVLDDALVDVGRRRRGRLCGGDDRVSRAKRDVSLHGVDVSRRLLDEVDLLAAPLRRGTLALLVDEHRLLRCCSTSAPRTVAEALLTTRLTCAPRRLAVATVSTSNCDAAAAASAACSTVTS